MKNNYHICTKTVMDTSDPTITFDENGISNHYWDFVKNTKKKWYPNQAGKDLLDKKIKNLIKAGKGKKFDCIIGLSGGVDSSYMLHKLMNNYELRPLVFHVDGGWNSEESVNNINVLVDKLGLDLYTEVINWNEMKDFQLAMFKSGVPHIDIPQDMAFIGTLYKFASQHNIKYIFNGGNISTECVLMPLEILYWGTDMRQVKDILNKFGTKKMSTYPFSSILYHKVYLKYLKRVNILKPLNFMPYKKIEAINELKEIYNWKPYKQKHFESRFTKFLEGYWLPTRFGYDMRRNQLSSLILTKQMSRDDALKELEKPSFDENNLQQELAYISKKLGISVEDLNNYHTMEKKFYWDYKNIKKLFDLGEWILTNLKITQRGGAF